VRLTDNSSAVENAAAAIYNVSGPSLRAGYMNEINSVLRVTQHTRVYKIWWAERQLLLPMHRVKTCFFYLCFSSTF